MVNLLSQTSVHRTLFFRSGKTVKQNTSMSLHHVQCHLFPLSLCDFPGVFRKFQKKQAKNNHCNIVISAVQGIHHGYSHLYGKTIPSGKRLQL